MQKLYILILTFLFVNLLNAQNIKISFTVYTQDNDTIFITGNLPQLGNWNPGKVKLNKQGNKNIIELEFNKGDYLEYKFTKGNWANEALDINGNIPPNSTLRVKNDTNIVINISKWSEGKSKILFNGKITGNVKYHKNFNGKGLVPRDVVVWLPPDYDEKPDKKFPVLYMHDGQNLFDPTTSSFGIDWQADETADSLIKQGKMKSIIIVGIYSTVNRTAEYTPTDTSKLYMDFVVKQLKPFIDSTYKTLPNRENCYTGGSSAGGLISFMLHWEYNDVFAAAICFSPAFKVAWIDYVSVVNNTTSQKNIKVYITNGGLGVDERLQAGVDEMVNVLNKKTYVLNKDYFVNIFPNDNHSEEYWAKRLPNCFLTLFGI